MEVLRYKSSDGHVEIKITTGNIRSSWNRFNGRIDSGASIYCDYKATKPGWLYLTNFKTFDDEPKKLNENVQYEWNELPPVMYETCPYGINIRFHNIEGKPYICTQNERSNRFIQLLQYG